MLVENGMMGCKSGDAVCTVKYFYSHTILLIVSLYVSYLFGRWLLFKINLIPGMGANAGQPIIFRCTGVGWC